MRTLIFCASLLYVAAGVDDTELLLPSQAARHVEQAAFVAPDWIGTSERLRLDDGTD